VPYKKTSDGPGEPETAATEYGQGFGVINGAADALDDSRARLALMRSRGITWVCLTAGSPYYCPHVVRPALFPLIDGYEPPEDPLPLRGKST
jgi:NADPH2 dehydrogenase